MSAIQVRGLSRTFRTRQPVVALDGVDLAVADGTLVAVLGPSGCGKTTLLRSIAGLERPDSGSISIGATVVEDTDVHVPANRREVGLVPQEGALFPHLDVGRNVSFGLKGRPRAECRARVAELLELIGMPDAARRRPHQLSGGQQQRVALARALAPSPGVVLLDEPFSALDTGLRAAIRSEVADLLHREKTTAMLVTHDQIEAMTMADTLAVMRAGRIVQVGPPNEVYRHPVDAWVGTFLGDAVCVPGRRVGDASVTSPLGSCTLAAGFDHHDGIDVTVFLRPEQLRPAPEGRGFAAAVTAVRFQGSETLVDLAIDGLDRPVTARWSSTTPVEVGARMRVEVEGTAIAHAPIA